MMDTIRYIPLFLTISWIICVIISLIICVIEDEDIDVKRQKVLFIFPANLIFIIKYWWKTIIEAIKS